MGYVVAIFGGITVLYSVMFLLVARSAMHETTAAALWCGGWLMIAAGFGLARLHQSLTVIPGERPKPE